MRISDWSSDVCSSDLNPALVRELPQPRRHTAMVEVFCQHGLVRDPRSVFQRCNPLGTNGMYRAAEFLDAVSKPQEVFLGNPIVLRLCRARNYAELAWDARVFR